MKIKWYPLHLDMENKGEQKGDLKDVTKCFCVTDLGTVGEAKV